MAVAEEADAEGGVVHLDAGAHQGQEFLLQRAAVEMPVQRVAQIDDDVVRHHEIAVVLNLGAARHAVGAVVVHQHQVRPQPPEVAARRANPADVIGAQSGDEQAERRRGPQARAQHGGGEQRGYRQPGDGITQGAHAPVPTRGRRQPFDGRAVDVEPRFRFILRRHINLGVQLLQPAQPDKGRGRRGEHQEHRHLQRAGKAPPRLLRRHLLRDGLLREGRRGAGAGVEAVQGIEGGVGRQHRRAPRD